MNNLLILLQHDAMLMPIECQARRLKGVRELMKQKSWSKKEGAR